jgi:N-acyl-D-aspartate/D-glutamate deacylase
MAHEIAIRGGTLIDGTGAPRRRADLGISGGVVAEIGPKVHGDVELDAAGSFVTPGFIDVHTHYDAQVLWDPFITPSSIQAVTTVIMGSCGFSIAPCRPETRDLMLRTLQYVEGMDLQTMEAGVDWSWQTYGEYLDHVAARGTAINFGGYVGHTAVRLNVMGEEGYEREATAQEIMAMADVVRQAIRAGALGFSSDQSPYHHGDAARLVPSAVGSHDEVLTLMRAVGEVGRGVCMVIIDPLNFEWVFDVQAEIDRPLNWCQFMTWPKNSVWSGSTPLQLQRQRVATSAGARIYGQATCKPITQQFTLSNPITWYSSPAVAETATLDLDETMERLRDPSWRARARADLAGSTDPNWDKWILTETTKHQELAGLTLTEIARRRGQTPFEALLDTSLDEDLETRFTVTSANDDFDELREILRADGAILGLSDAGAHCDQMCDANMLTDFLAHWVRDQDLLPLEAGVRKVSGEPAMVVDLHDRGTLEVGKAADVAVWDLETLDPGPMRRVYDFPAGGTRLVADEPSGFAHVLVNGVPIRRDGHSLLGDLTSLPGRTLRS